MMIIYHIIIFLLVFLLLELLAISPISSPLLAPITQPPPRLPHIVVCVHAYVDVCPLADLFQFPHLLPSEICLSVPCIRTSGFILFIRVHR